MDEHRPMQDAFLDLRILAHVIAKNGEQIDLPDATIDALAGGSSKAEHALASLETRNAISIDGYEEDGFKGNWWMTPGPSIFACLNEEVEQIASAYGASVLAAEAEKDRVNRLIGFDLEKARKATNQINEEIGRVATEIERSPMLQPMQPLVSDIARHFVAVQGVLTNFEDVYQGVIRPIQAEGRSGIRHTAIWAILGIAASTAVSVGLSLWAR